MKFGLLHLFESPGEKSEKAIIDENLEMIQAADELDFDSVWLAEHHFSIYGVMPSIAVMASALAMKAKPHPDWDRSGGFAPPQPHPRRRRVRAGRPAEQWKAGFRRGAWLPTQ